MKFVVVTILTMALSTLTACSTASGFVKGVGEDIKAGTDWTASKIKPN
jgi:predicted small secreted protein